MRAVNGQKLSAQGIKPAATSKLQSLTGDMAGVMPKRESLRAKEQRSGRGRQLDAVDSIVQLAASSAGEEMKMGRDGSRTPPRQAAELPEPRSPAATTHCSATPPSTPAAVALLAMLSDARGEGRGRVSKESIPDDEEEDLEVEDDYSKQGGGDGGELADEDMSDDGEEQDSPGQGRPAASDGRRDRKGLQGWEIPDELNVACNETVGKFDTRRFTIYCLCNQCSLNEKRFGREDVTYTPNGWETHTGRGAAKKWRMSVRVLDPHPTLESTDLPIVKWLGLMGQGSDEEPARGREGRRRDRPLGDVPGDARRPKQLKLEAWSPSSTASAQGGGSRGATPREHPKVNGKALALPLALDSPSTAGGSTPATPAGPALLYVTNPSSGTTFAVPIEAGSTLTSSIAGPAVVVALPAVLATPMNGGTADVLAGSQQLADTKELEVACNGLKGTLAMASLTIVCHCGACKGREEHTGPAWEVHAGRGASRDWRRSVRVPQVHPLLGTANLNIGKWLETMGLDGKKRSAVPGAVLTPRGSGAAAERGVRSGGGPKEPEPREGRSTPTGARGTTPRAAPLRALRQVKPAEDAAAAGPGALSRRAGSPGELLSGRGVEEPAGAERCNRKGQYVGQRVRMEFSQCSETWFPGTIEEYIPSLFSYRVRYQDGASEDVVLPDPTVSLLPFDPQPRELKRAASSIVDVANRVTANCAIQPTTDAEWMQFQDALIGAVSTAQGAAQLLWLYSRMSPTVMREGWFEPGGISNLDAAAGDDDQAEEESDIVSDASWRQAVERLVALPTLPTPSPPPHRSLPPMAGVDAGGEAEEARGREERSAGLLAPCFGVQALQGLVRAFSVALDWRLMESLQRAEEVGDTKAVDRLLARRTRQHQKTSRKL